MEQCNAMLVCEPAKRDTIKRTATSPDGSVIWTQHYVCMTMLGMGTALVTQSRTETGGETFGGET